MTYMITPGQIKEWRSIAAGIGTPWHAVAGGDVPEDDRDGAIWTLSRTGDPGWSTDDGFPGYGMQETDARYAALAMTVFPLLVDELDRLYAAACPACGTLVHRGHARARTSGPEAEIRFALAEGQTRADLVRVGYKKSTVYKVAKNFYSQFQEEREPTHE